MSNRVDFCCPDFNKLSASFQNSMLSHFQTHPLWYDGVHLLLCDKWVSAKSAIEGCKNQKYRMTGWCRSQSSRQQRRAGQFWLFVWVVLSQKGSFIPVPPSVLFFFLFKLFCPYLVKNLQEVTESRLILANCGCACVSEYEREDLRGCQMPRDAAEHVGTREGRGTGKTDRHNASMWRIHIPSA